MNVNPRNNASFYNCFFPWGNRPFGTYTGRLHLKGEPFSADAMVFLIRTKEVHLSCI